MTARVLISFDAPAGAQQSTWAAFLIDRLRAAGFTPSSVFLEEHPNRVRTAGASNPLIELYTSRSGQQCGDVARARDGHTCRYCGGTTDPDAPRRDTRREVLDLVDPFGPLDPDNVVVACLSCSTRKASRPCDAAGMTVRPAPTARRSTSRKKETV